MDNILLAYIHEKEQKQNDRLQSERRNVVLNDNINLDNEMKLSDGRVYDVNDIRDPIKHQGKGRPNTKRFKAYNEEKTKWIKKKMCTRWMVT